MVCVEDGPNDSERYNETSLKIFHLLKQPTQDNDSLPKLVQQVVKANNLGKKFLYRLATRTYGLLNGFEPWETVIEREHEDVEGLGVLGDALLRSGIVNLKNDSVANSTPKSNVYEWAQSYITRWHGQIEKWKPQLVVCGGTFDAVKNALSPKDVRTASTGMQWFADPKLDNCIYLDAPHPSARYPRRMVHTYLMASAQDILKSCRVGR